MRAVDLLREPLTPDQKTLLALLADVYRRERIWPTWPYVWSHLEVGAVAAEQALRTLPKLGRRIGHYGMLYGLAWTDPDLHDLSGVPNDTRIGLTMAGLWRAGEQELVHEFLAVLSAAVRAYDDFRPGPTDTGRPTFTSAQAVRAGLLPGKLLQVDDVPFWRRLWNGRVRTTV